MFGIFKKNKKKEQNEDEDIIVISKPKEYECGGNETYIYKKAPKEIVSDDVVYFDFSTACDYIQDECTDVLELSKIVKVSAFACKTEKNTFVFLNTIDRYRENEKSQCALLISDDLFSEINKLVKQYNIAENNGYHSKTHGLPDNFGGEITVEYASGEKINISDNQGPFVATEFVENIVKVFKQYLKGKKAKMPNIDTLKTILYNEEGEGGSYKKAKLVINEDGSGVNYRESRYNDPKIYNSEKIVPKEKIDEIKKNIVDNYVLLWSGLPFNGFERDKSSLTFVFDDSEIVVENGRCVPDKIRSGFFNVQLQMTVVF